MEETLLSLRQAMEAFWAASSFEPVGPPLEEQAVKEFPDAGGWFWRTGCEGAPVHEPALVRWLDARWSIVESAYRSYQKLAPRIVESGRDAEPRGLEMWEWSCIGMHRLWEGWNDPEGLIRVDLRPALFDVGDGFEQERLEAYLLFFPRGAVEAVTEHFAARRTPRIVAWHRTVADVVARHGLTTERKPADVLHAAIDDGLCQRTGDHVSVSVGEGLSKSVAITTFRRIARRALSENPWLAFAAPI